MNNAETLKQKREERAAALEAVNALAGKIEARTWNDATDGPALNDAKTKLEGLESEVRALETALDIDARSQNWKKPEVQAPAIIDADKRGDAPEKLQKRYSFADAVRSLTGQKVNDVGFIREMQQEAEREMREAGVNSYGTGILIPAMLQMQKRDQTVTVGEGGYTIQTEIGQLIPFLEPQAIVNRMGATFYRDLRGNVDFPRVSAVTSAAWEGEQTAGDETSMTFDRVQMTPHRLSAWTDISMQLMRQSEINIENTVRADLMRARDKKLDVAALTGDGTNNVPAGIISASGVNVITVAGAPTWAKMVEFETKVAEDDADFGTLAYLFNPTTVGKLKTTERESGTGIYLWNGVQNRDQDGEVNGYRAFRSTQVPGGAVAQYAFFGNWRKLLIGQWGGMELALDPYTRMTEATVRVVLNSWHDVAVQHGAAFAYTANIHTS